MKNKNYLTKLMGTLLILSITTSSCSKDDNETPNKPPEAFNLIGVTNNAQGVDVFPTFSWQEAIDPDGDNVSYNLYLGKEEQPNTLYAENLTNTNFTVTERLSLNSTYNWKVVAEDAQQVTNSETFKFATRGLNIPNKPITDNANFSGRINHTSVVFDNKLWVIGGDADLQLNNDVWCSINGETWTEVTNNAAFSFRTTHASVVFNNKIWVIGGSANLGRSNDVWSSKDGRSWTLENEEAPFSKRTDLNAFVFDSKIWVIGGFDGEIKKDAWYSSDGITWTLATDSLPFATFGRSYVVFDNKIWGIGGYDGSLSKDVWHSSDGITWSLVSNNTPFSERFFHTCVVFDYKLWIIGGAGENTNTNDIWYSINGVDWIEVTFNLGFSPRSSHTSTVYKDKIWLIGGGSSNELNDVWTFD